MATALHDGVLQTLEMLHRSTDIDDVGLRAQVADRATWLRRYIETGRGDQGGDLGVDLDAVVTAARQAGITVEVNAARLLASDDGLEETFQVSGQSPVMLATPQREAMIEALFQTISSFGPDPAAVIMVRAVPEQGGVHVTVLATGEATPSGTDVAEAGARLVSAGGWLRATPVPCIELWVPGIGAGDGRPAPGDAQPTPGDAQPIPDNGQPAPADSRPTAADEFP
ncbi:hypothetical protein ACFQ9X_48415 [Catenulispora yoronensis]